MVSEVCGTCGKPLPGEAVANVVAYCSPRCYGIAQAKVADQ